MAEVTEFDPTGYYTCDTCHEPVDFYEVESFFGGTIRRYWFHAKLPQNHEAVPVLTKQEHD